MLFLCPQRSSGPYISRNFLIWTHFVNASRKKTYACTFSVQRKEINDVKVRFTMSYSSRKLINYKVTTTACNFWRQIAYSFQVMSGNILFLGNKIFEIPPFFKPGQGIWAKKFTHPHYVFPPWKVHRVRSMHLRWSSSSVVFMCLISATQKFKLEKNTLNTKE